MDLNWFIERPHPDKAGYLQIDGFAEEADAITKAEAWRAERPDLQVSRWENPRRVMDRLKATLLPVADRRALLVEAAGRLRARIGELAPGGCKLLSEGASCTCPLCDIDRLMPADAEWIVPLQLVAFLALLADGDVPTNLQDQAIALLGQVGYTLSPVAVPVAPGEVFPEAPGFTPFRDAFPATEPAALRQVRSSNIHAIGADQVIKLTDAERDALVVEPMGTVTNP